MSADSPFGPPPPGKRLVGFIFRAWTTHWKTGERIYPAPGKKCIRIPIYA